MELESLLTWSRAQFALTACYHWLFVPLTLGLGVIMAIAETIYYRTNKPEWKSWAKFWQKLFGINFAIGVATGIILEFEFGTNWSNYSWLVGDIFGAPLAIEGVLAFFMEATFIAVMFFGWEKVSRRFHLASTWLTIVGASLSAVWILAANSWMQHPVGMEFNPETVRSEMVSATSFWEILTTGTNLNKLSHTIFSCWLLGSVFAMGVCAFYLRKKETRHTEFALRNMRIIAPFGLLAAILTVGTGDTSANNIAKHQPMKLAAIEALYEGGESTPEGKKIDGQGTGLSVFGIISPQKAQPLAEADPFIFNVKVPSLLSFLATRSSDGYVPGINNLLRGDFYLPDGTKALSAEEKMARGRLALEALEAFHQAKTAGDKAEMEVQRAILQKHFPYFGYGKINHPEELVPNVHINYYAFRIMVGLGMLFVLLFIIGLWLSRNAKRLQHAGWFHLACLIAMPLVWLASQSGWIVAEMGRQPWAIQDMLPVSAALSALSATSVMVTFFLFLVLFTVLLIAEISIMVKSIKTGPAPESSHSDN